MLGYLFFVGDRKNTARIRADTDASDRGSACVTRRPLPLPALLRLAEAARDRYGFRDFKFKGGVFTGAVEMEAIVALAKRFPNARVTMDPNGAW